MTVTDDPPYRLGLALAEVSRLWRHVLDARLKPLGLSTARWVARQAGDDVVRVVLTRTFRDVRPPGDPKPRPAAGRYDFYTLELP